ncbi:unnamed protein product [Phytophthora lilii]|uniref:Unnamed protein product n=1 Tax=Phytophthora lilii TaxID=2077276 RepID=A0A9W6XC16_9STRA|nr:unnamed protein product [Phytophthora lilii]
MRLEKKKRGGEEYEELDVILKDRRLPNITFDRKITSTTSDDERSRFKMLWIILRNMEMLESSGLIKSITPIFKDQPLEQLLLMDTGTLWSSWRTRFRCGTAALSSTFFATAMSNAISGGHADVVAALLTWGEWKGDFGKVFEKAVANVAKKVYELYPQVTCGGNLLVDMAARGRLDAVKYMYGHGHRDPKLLDEALGRASAGICTAVIMFLKAFSVDSPEMIAAAFYGK